MTVFETRQLAPGEYRRAHDMTRIALHRKPGDDADWALREPSYEPGRTFGAFSAGEVVGAAQSYASQLAVPGGKVVPTALVSRVGVRADHTRRGLLTGLMRAQLDALDEPLAALHASEAVIYGRFGYGMASRCRNVAVAKRRAALRPDAPEGGRVRMVTPDEAWKILPEIYDHIGPRHSGWVHRPGHLWDSYKSWYNDNNYYPITVVHTGDNGDDGYAQYCVKEDNYRASMAVTEWFAGSTPAWAGLFRYLLSVDLVDELKIWARPLDDPLEWLLTDYRAITTEEVEDDAWLRLVNVEEALSARTYTGPGSVVIEVQDKFLPANSGNYSISANGVSRTDSAAQLSLPVDILASIYLGDIQPSTLAKAGRLAVLDAEALPVADTLFGTSAAPWMASGF